VVKPASWLADQSSTVVTQGGSILLSGVQARRGSCNGWHNKVHIDAHECTNVRKPAAGRFGTLPVQRSLAVLAEFPNADLVGRKPDDFSRPFGFRFEFPVAQQSLNVAGGFQDWQVQNDQTVVAVTELLAEEAQIAREHCHAACRVKIAENLLLVVPLGPADLKADLAA